MKKIFLVLTLFSQFTSAQTESAISSTPTPKGGPPSNVNPSLHGDLNDKASESKKSKMARKPKVKGQTDSTRSDIDHATDSPLVNPSQGPASGQ